MQQISGIAAFGLWPALPITGYWLLSRRRGKEGEGPPAVSAFALAATVGLAVWSLPLLGSVVLGLYRGAVLGILGWAVTLVGLVALVRGRRLAAPIARRWDGSDAALAIGLVLAAVLYLGFPAENIEAQHDEGMYAGHAIWIARHGGVDIPYPWPEGEESLFAPVLTRPRGLGFDGASMTPWFGHLFPAWLAHAFSTFGPAGLYRLNAVFALLASGAFFGVCRLVAPKPIATVAALFFALNPAQLWIARVTLSEILTQLLFSSGLLLLLRAFADREAPLARWAGLILGATALVRVDSLLLLPLLLVAHVLTRLVEDPEERSTATWIALYQTALPTLALALSYYILFSRPYFDAHASAVFRILALALALILVLAGTREPLARRLRPVIRSRGALAAVGLAVAAAATYAYWIRPTMAPFAVEAPSGARTYVEDTLVNLAQYISPLVVWAAILGWILALWAAVRTRRNPGLLAVLVVTGGMAALYLRNPFVTPLHFWAIRRFIPTIIPGMILFAAFLATWVGWTLRGHWRVALGAVTALFLAAFTIRADSRIYALAEHQGTYAQVEELAASLPPGEPVLAAGSTRWTTPLYLAFDRPIVPLRMRTGQAKDAFIEWVRQRSAQGRSTTVMYAANDPRERAAGAGFLPLTRLDYRQVGRALISRSFAEWTPHPLPAATMHDTVDIRLLEIRDATQRVTNINLVREGLWGVVQSGFAERGPGGRGPWTTGRSVVRVPLEGQPMPTALQVRLGAVRGGVEWIRIMVNGRKVFAGTADDLSCEGILSLAGVPARDAVTITIFSLTAAPGEPDVPPRGEQEPGVLLEQLVLENERPDSDRTSRQVADAKDTACPPEAV